MSKKASINQVNKARFKEIVKTSSGTGGGRRTLSFGPVANNRTATVARSTEAGRSRRRLSSSILDGTDRIVVVKGDDPTIGIRGLTALFIFVTLHISCCLNG